VSPPPIEPEAEERLRIQAAAWFARMRSPASEQDHAEFDTWLAQPGHREFYERMAVRWRQSDLLSHTRVGREREGFPPPRARKYPGRYYALAASLIAVIAVGLIFWAWSGDRLGAGGQSGMAGAAITSPVGIRQVRLADSSIVTLDTASAIEVQMSEGTRRIKLVRGRARFEVAHDASRPFIVLAGGEEVVALGTIFDVSLTSGGSRVSLLRGSVEVRHASGDGKPGRVIARLAPGQAIALVGDTPVVQNAPPADAVWTKGMLAFDGAPLAEVLAAANRYSGRKVAFDDPALAALKVTGTFHVDRPDELAATLAAAFGLEVARRGDGYVLRRPVF
jgi:transmembrane sensor